MKSLGLAALLGLLLTGIVAGCGNDDFEESGFPEDVEVPAEDV